MNEIDQIYFDRTADRSLKRCLCQFPTIAAAQEAGMSLEEYEAFVYNACNLYAADPEAEWLKVRASQQHIVDYLNKADIIQYKNPKSDIKFSVKYRIWINSDGRSNMPSGEVFTGPIEDTVEGYIYFNYPIVYMGQEVEGVTLHVEKGQVVSWEAEKGKAFLDDIFKIEGARYFGEVAIGTNYNIQRTTKNILFDEKIGGSIHMAIGYFSFSDKAIVKVVNIDIIVRLIAAIFRRLHTILSPDANFQGYWTELSRGWHPHLTDMVKISQGKQQVELLCILEQSSVTGFGITKLSFDNTKRMLHLCAE